MTDQNEAEPLVKKEDGQEGDKPEAVKKPEVTPPKKEGEGQREQPTTGSALRLGPIDIFETAKKSGMSIKCALFEFVAMYFFVLAICLTDFDVSKFILGMWIIMTLFMNFSGAHINPAVTFGVFISDPSFDIAKLFLYWGFQVLASFLAVNTSNVFLKEVGHFTIPEVKSTWFRILFAEAFLTGTFVFIVQFQQDVFTKSSKSPALNTIIMICWFYFISAIGAQTTGGAYNPATLIAVNVHAYRVGKDLNAVNGCGRLILAELFGALFFGTCYRLFFRNHYENRYGHEEKE
jgi:glycerol uptake facilitator-like aquaporin